MELKELFAFFNKSIRLIFISTILFGLLSIAVYYFYPVKYYASGGLFITRTIYPYQNTHFTYEGYYGQQAAIFYTNSIIGLIESEDIGAQALGAVDQPVTEMTLRELSKKIKTEKSGPQLVTLIVKGKTQEGAITLWQALAQTTINTMRKINTEGDPFVGVAKVSETPIVKESYRNLPVFILVGMGMGCLLSVSLLAVKISLQDQPKQRAKRKR
jgi:capsular polysaccharide biosynthesis protein